MPIMADAECRLPQEVQGAPFEYLQHRWIMVLVCRWLSTLARRFPLASVSTGHTQSDIFAPGPDNPQVLPGDEANEMCSTGRHDRVPRFMILLRTRLIHRANW